MDIPQLEMALETANEFGISSIKQLLFFLKVSKQKHPSKSLLDLANTDDPLSPDYKRAVDQFIKLSKGSGYRNRNGLNLLEYIESGKNRRVGLTVKGKQLADKLNKIC